MDKPINPVWSLVCDTDGKRIGRYHVDMSGGEPYVSRRCRKIPVEQSLDDPNVYLLKNHEDAGKLKD